MNEVLTEPGLMGRLGRPVNNNAPIVSTHLPLHWKTFSEISEVEDHPGRRKESGFFQPIRHLSGNFLIYCYLL